MQRTMRFLILLAALALLPACYAAHSSGGETAAHYEEGLVDKAALTIRGMRNSPEFRHIDVYLKNAKGVLIFPSVIKAGLIYGGQGGNGVLLARDKDGSWSGPAFYTLGGGSIGLQIGVQEAAIVLVFMNDKALNSAIDSGLTLGADATAAAGTAGITGEVASTHAFKDVYYFANVDGLFAGISLEGGVISIRGGLNRDYYGKSFTPREILLDRKADSPNATMLREALSAPPRGK